MTLGPSNQSRYQNVTECEWKPYKLYKLKNFCSGFELATPPCPKTMGPFLSNWFWHPLEFFKYVFSWFLDLNGGSIGKIPNRFLDRLMGWRLEVFDWAFDSDVISVWGTKHSGFKGNVHFHWTWKLGLFEFKECFCNDLTVTNFFCQHCLFNFFRNCDKLYLKRWKMKQIKLACFPLNINTFTFYWN